MERDAGCCALGNDEPVGERKVLGDISLERDEEEGVEPLVLLHDAV